MEANLHEEQMKRKKDFLQHLLQQQNESDSIIHQMQKKKDQERQKLIGDILKGMTIKIIFHKLLRFDLTFLFDHLQKNKKPA